MTNHLWQSTVFAAAAWGLAAALKGNRAAVRYWVWFCASVKFLVPFAVLMSAGSHLHWTRAAQAIAPAKVSVVVERIAAPFTEVVPVVRPAAAGGVDWVPLGAAGVWACGFVAIAMMRLRGWRRVRAAVRASREIEIAAAVEVRSSPGLLEPGVVGLWRPILLLPEGIAERLTPAQLAAVLAHELSHVHRCDNLFAVVHMIVEALFWFHPLVWWIGAKLVEERELACDEEVLRLGSEPRVYADGILNVCRLYVESPLVCVAGVTGAEIKKRVEAIMSSRIVLRLNFGKKLLLAAAGVLAASGPLMIGLVKAQSQNPLAFEVASVRPHEYPPDRSVGGTGGSIRISGNRVTVLGSLTGLVMSAYNLKEFQISGAPHWTDRLGRQQHYDMSAKAEGDVALTLDQARRMIQTLLADRFQLKLHRESKEMPVYDLVVGKNGPKMKEHVGDTPPIEPPQFSGPLIKLKFVNRSMAALVGVLGSLDRPVLDKTGLTGGYDFTLEFTSNTRDPDADQPVFTAVQEQLGLRLAEAKELVEILVIDHAERPTEN